MSTDWANLEGRAAGAFPLLRLLGSSERSAVFLSRAATITPSDIALKLVPAIAGRAELLLPRWRSAATLEHPRLLRLFEAGECEIGGQRYLYSVMEYADQNLAQLLEHRALGPDEVREMLGPALDALEFLHGSKRVHGGLKPSNILVVGEQVKLASDAIGPVSDVANDGNAGAAGLSPYQPPEASGGGRSTAGDVWALGVTTCEALSRRKPAGLHAIGGGIALPSDIPSTFSEMILKCLSRNPEDRPDVASLKAWLQGGELAPMPVPEPLVPEQPPVAEHAGVADPGQATTSAGSTRLVIRAKLIPQDELTEPEELKARWRPVPLIIAGALLVGIVVAGIYFFSSHGSTSEEAKRSVAAPRVAAEAPRPQAVAPGTPASTTEAPRAVPETQASDSQSTIHEVIPAVPLSARQTIRGTIRVSVRVTVNEDGSVGSATSGDPGPSRYFERLSLEAARKWTFAPAQTGGKRLMLVKFNYTRSGATAKASPIQ